MTWITTQLSCSLTFGFCLSCGVVDAINVIMDYHKQHSSIRAPEKTLSQADDETTEGEPLESRQQNMQCPADGKTFRFGQSPQHNMNKGQDCKQAQGPDPDS